MRVRSVHAEPTRSRADLIALAHFAFATFQLSGSQRLKKMTLGKRRWGGERRDEAVGGVDTVCVGRAVGDIGLHAPIDRTLG